MESRKDVNRILGEMGEPPLGSADILQSPLEHADVAQTTAEANAEGEQPYIEMKEPKGFRRANLFFLNGRTLFIDMQDDELLQTIRDFLRDQNPESEFLTLPLIDTVGEGKDEVTVAAPIHLARKQLELLSSVGRSWMKQVPGQATTNSGVAVVRGEDAKTVILNMNREQRRRLRRQTGRG
jgi:hypothetical protein